MVVPTFYQRDELPTVDKVVKAERWER